MPPLISVNICCYNSEPFIKETINSVLRQTFRDFEIIAIDDGSTDRTGEIIKAFSDSRIHYYYQQNQGLAKARNKSLSLSRGKYVALLDHDDRWLPTKLEKQVSLLERLPSIKMLYSDCYVVYSDTGEKELYSTFTKYHRGEGALKWLFFGNYIPLPTIVFCRETALKAKGFDPELKLAEDYDFVIKMATYGGIDYIDEPLAEYYIHATNKSRESIAMQEEELRILNNNESLFSEIIPVEARQKRLKGIYWGLAYLYAQQDDPARSNALIQAALTKYGCDFKFLFLMARKAAPFLSRLFDWLKGMRRRGMWAQ